MHVGGTTEFVFHTDESVNYAGFKLCEEAAPATSVVGSSCTHECNAGFEGADCAASSSCIVSAPAAGELGSCGTNDTWTDGANFGWSSDPHEACLAWSANESSAGSLAASCNTTFGRTKCALTCFGGATAVLESGASCVPACKTGYTPKFAPSAACDAGNLTMTADLCMLPCDITAPQNGELGNCTSTRAHGAN